MKYIWLNPVVKAQYDENILEKFLTSKGFVEIFPREDHANIVREKYKKVLETSESNVCDMRCPKSVEIFQNQNKDWVFPKIEPILIHVARELAGREDLLGVEKWIVTPCASLKNLGERLELKDTKFITWREFIERFSFTEEPKILHKSPIPMGFFKDLGETPEGESKGDGFKNPTNRRIVESMFCKDGCHNGDGIINE